MDALTVCLLIFLFLINNGIWLVFVWYLLYTLLPSENRRYMKLPSNPLQKKQPIKTESDLRPINEVSLDQLAKAYNVESFKGSGEEQPYTPKHSSEKSN